MKSSYLLILEGDTGKGFSAWFPDLPCVLVCGNSRRQTEMLAKDVAEEELQELDNVPVAECHSSRQIDLLLQAF